MVIALTGLGAMLLGGSLPAAAAHPALQVGTAGALDTDGDGLRDSFELAAGLDPERRDSDGDGLRDPAEDLDGDTLSNLGEQRFHTDPLLTDTDLDTVDDGAEDSDDDGIRDAWEQDRRPIPDGVHPAIRAAYADSPPSYHDGCHLALTSTAFRVCTYGRRDAATQIVLFGDSHAAQWLPALDRAGRREGWRIVSFTRSGCPFAVVKVHRSSDSDVPCERWRQQVLRWIGRHRPGVVILSSLAGYWLTSGSLSWWAGVSRVVARMPAGTVPLVLADTPAMTGDVPACLLANQDRISACSRARAAATHVRWRAREERLVTGLGGRYGDLTGLVCPYDPCPAIVDQLLLWRDRGHLTRTYSLVLTPSVQRLVTDTLSATALPPDPAPPVRRGR
ncbi:MAG: SGNH hydrolase domain-containing protein [Chloroflexota bacterium]